jgi:hypothetical protein
MHGTKCRQLSCNSEQFQNGLQKTQRRIGGNHIESQDWSKDEIGVLTWSQQQSLRGPRGTNETHPTSIQISVVNETWGPSILVAVPLAPHMSPPPLLSRCSRSTAACNPRGPAM